MQWEDTMRSITTYIEAMVLAGGLVGAPSAGLALMDEPPSQNPPAVTDRDVEKATGAQETTSAAREEKGTATGPSDVQERAIRQGAGAPGESPVCVCVSPAGQCVFSAVHGCVPSQGPVTCNGGCFEQKPQAGKVRPSVLPKAHGPVIRRGVEGEQPEAGMANPSGTSSETK